MHSANTIVLMINPNTPNITRELLEGHPDSLEAIALHSGVGYHWLGKFKQGKYEDPGFSKIARLYNYLTSFHGEDSAAPQ